MEAVATVRERCVPQPISASHVLGMAARCISTVRLQLDLASYIFATAQSSYERPHTTWNELLSLQQSLPLRSACVAGSDHHTARMISCPHV